MLIWMIIMPEGLYDSVLETLPKSSLLSPLELCFHIFGFLVLMELTLPFFSLHPKVSSLTFFCIDFNQHIVGSSFCL